MAFISHRRVRRLGEDCDLSRPPPVIKIIARKFSLFSALLSNQLFSFFLFLVPFCRRVASFARFSGTPSPPRVTLGKLESRTPVVE